jgi:hypothetical protein
MVRLFKKYLDVTKIELDEKNRMARIGYGLNEGRPFFRIDLWKRGYRITRKEK